MWLEIQNAEMSLRFPLTSLVIVMSPGTGRCTIAAGLGGGATANVIAALGCTLGVVPHLVGDRLGLLRFLYTSSVAFQRLKFLGAA